MEQTVHINFPNVTPREAGELAVELQEYLNNNGVDKADVIKTQNDTLDFGSTLAIILASSSVIEIAKGIANWLVKKREVKISVKTKDGEFTADNISSGDIKSILEQVMNRQNAVGEK